MAGRKQYSVRDVRLAIEAVGSRVADIAKHLDCTTSTVYRYLRKHPELRTAHERVGGEVESKPRYYEAIAKAISGSRGNYTTIAKAVGCSRQTVHNYMVKYPELMDETRIERASLVDMAESAAAVLLAQLDGPTVRFVLGTLGAERGWKQQSSLEVSGLGISAETVALLEAMGKDPATAVHQFEQLVRMQSERVDSSK